MKVIKKLGFLLSLVGIIMYLPPMMEFLTLHFGKTIGQFSGIVSFAIGWGILGAHFAFSAGFGYQHERITKKLQQNFDIIKQTEQKNKNRKTEASENL